MTYRQRSTARGRFRRLTARIRVLKSRLNRWSTATVLRRCASDWHYPLARVVRVQIRVRRINRIARYKGAA